MLKVKSLTLGRENNGNMLELQKMVLKNVKNDPILFKKELIKSKRWLDKESYKKLQNWISENFEEQHMNIAEKVEMIEF